MPHLSALYCYPVKSCRGVALSEATLDRRGIVHDREMLIVDAQKPPHHPTRDPRARAHRNGAYRRRPPPARSRRGRASRPLARARRRTRSRHARGRHLARHRRGRRHRRPRRRVALGFPRRKPAGWSRPARIRAGYGRPSTPRRRSPRGVGPPGGTRFPRRAIRSWSSPRNRSPTSTAASTCPNPSPWTASGPISSWKAATAPYAEDTWKAFRVGEVRLFGGGPCGRCIIITTDQQTLERAPRNRCARWPATGVRRGATWCSARTPSSPSPADGCGWAIASCRKPTPGLTSTIPARPRLAHEERRPFAASSSVDRAPARSWRTPVSSSAACETRMPEAINTAAVRQRGADAREQARSAVR